MHATCITCDMTCYCHMNVIVILCAIEVHDVTMETGVSVGMCDHTIRSHAYNKQVYQGRKYMGTQSCFNLVLATL